MVRIIHLAKDMTSIWSMRPNKILAMKKIISTTIFLLFPFLLCSCDGGSYLATGLFKSNNGTSCDLSFLSFEGHYTFELNRYSRDHDFKYSLSLESGEVNIYYQWATFDKALLINIKDKQNLEGSSGYVSGNYKAKIIIETVTKCENGSFHIAYE